MKATKKAFIFVLAVLCFSFFACSKSENNKKAITYKDGTYSAVSEVKDKWGGYIEVKIEIKDGKIASCEMIQYEESGVVKGVDYGKDNGVIKNYGFYKIAQNAIEKTEDYPIQFIEKQDIEFLDVVEGATLSFDMFKNAVNLALAEAEEK